jgi:hypothetical protein
VGSSIPSSASTAGPAITPANHPNSTRQDQQGRSKITLWGVRNAEDALTAGQPVSRRQRRVASLLAAVLTCGWPQSRDSR